MLGLPGNLSRTMPANTGVAGLLPPGMPGATNVPAGAVFPHASAWRNRVRKLKRERSTLRNAGTAPIAECDGATLGFSPVKPGRAGAGVGSGTNSTVELPELS